MEHNDISFSIIRKVFAVIWKEGRPMVINSKNFLKLSKDEVEMAKYIQERLDTGFCKGNEALYVMGMCKRHQEALFVMGMCKKYHMSDVKDPETDGGEI